MHLSTKHGNISTFLKRHFKVTSKPAGHMVCAEQHFVTKLV